MHLRLPKMETYTIKLHIYMYEKHNMKLLNIHSIGTCILPRAIHSSAPSTVLEVQYDLYQAV